MVAGARTIDRFSLRTHRIGMSPNARGSIRLPLLEFELETPPSQEKKVEAWLEGENNERLRLAELKQDTSERIYGRLGFERPLKSPRLIVQSEGKTVLDTPLEGFPKPMRAIPLVVPIDPSVRLRRIPDAKAKDLARAYPGETFYSLESKTGGACPIASHILRTDWTANAEVAFQLKGSKRAPVFGFPKGDVGRIAELDQPEFSIRDSVQTVDLKVETFLRDGQLGLRVAKPHTVRFADGAQIEIRDQERMATRAQPAFGISSREILGFGLMIVPVSKPFAIEPMPPTHRERPPAPEFDGVNATRMELVSPPLDDLGIVRLRIGPYQLNGKTSRNVAIVPGRHTLRLRFTRKIIQVVDRRRFVEIES